MRKVHIPATIEEAVPILTRWEHDITATNWGRAAFVYAFTANQQGNNQHQRKTADARLGVNEFARLGIPGLKDHETVKKYRDAWAYAIAEYSAPDVKPGDALPLVGDNWQWGARIHEVTKRDPIESNYSADLRAGVNKLMPVLHAIRDGRWSPDVMEQTLITFLINPQLVAEIENGNESTTNLFDEIQGYLERARA